MDRATLMDAAAINLGIGLATGLMAFAHCLGMCGGFVVNLSLERDRSRMIAGQLSWHAGRICSYTLLGAAAGFAGGHIQSLAIGHARFQHLFGYAAGAVIVLMGLSLLGLLPVGRNAGSDESLLSAVCRRLFSSPTPGAALLMGIVAGLLPCPISLALLTYALQSGSVVVGMALMGGLGIGTLLPLLLLGLANRLGGLHRRRWSARIGGGALVLMGVLIMARGTGICHRLLGCPTGPAIPRSIAAGEHPRCCPDTKAVNGNDR
ncbi:sulfite exporter TauE/SafE family protein [Geobacter sp. SVR]|uniref:sulfite exporter TauE/SafE family protein n=1 Tax=Geobacter sp. SVR TaxID=2495594 RepID=UPI00143EF51F|nr:sulfite exporter TauE/SafE family protein [Geobacter sp. SVR]BCS54199.1 hypothetical protein GSVR_25070 [Geobacter sp. SVR]GCF85942.1 hypothetical protein GSbR_25420 [Geobacter sp. SVR]